MGGNFPGGGGHFFLGGGNFPGINFPGSIFLEGIFPRTTKMNSE